MPLFGLIDRVVGFLSSFLPGEIIGVGSQLYNIVPIAVFAIFVYLIYKSLKVAFRGILVFVAGAAFPFFANYLFEAGIPIALDIMISYGFIALLAYLAYVFFGTIVKVLKIVTWPVRKLFGNDEKVTRREVEELMEEDEDE